MPISYIYTGNPTVGTEDDDFIFPTTSYAGTESNTIYGHGGDDLVIGDAGRVFTIGLDQGNASIGNAVNLDASTHWTTSENPLFGDSSIPHTTVIAEATVGQTEFYSVTVGAGQTMTIDLDFGQSAIGASGDLVVMVRNAAGDILAQNSLSNSTSVGGLGSTSQHDPYLTFTAPAAGVYYIEVSEQVVGAFSTNVTYLLNLSVTGHATSLAAYGDDVIYGDAGNDTLLGQGGIDLIVGGLGDDVIHGGSGDDTLDGGAGADHITGGDGWDVVRYADSTTGVYVALWDNSGSLGEAEGDILESVEQVIGSAFDDDLSGSANDDILDGGDGDDELYGLAGDDALAGGYGADNLTGGEGVDTLTGGAGADTFRFSTGADSPHGGSTWDHVTDFATGEDILNFTGQAGRISVWTQDGFTYLSFDRPAFGGAAAGLIRVTGAVQGTDIVTDGSGLLMDGDAAANELRSGGGADTLNGLGNDDHLYGGAGDDLLFGGDGEDRIRGEDGIDDLYGEAGNDFLYSSLGADRFFGGDGTDTVIYEFELIESGVTFDASAIVNGAGQIDDGEGNLDTLTSIERLTVLGSSHADSLTGSGGIDHLQGKDGDDSLTGLGGSDNLDGGSGADTLHGGEGDDALNGGAGDDVLYGGEGSDRLYGSEGYDYLDGGAGADTFEWRASSESPNIDGSYDRVAEFETGVDRLAFTTEVGGQLTFTGTILIQRAGTANLIYFDEQQSGAFAGLVQVYGMVQAADIQFDGPALTLRMNGQETAADDLRGGFGADLIFGLGGDDVISGGGGADVLVGGAGADALDGGDGTDTADYSSSNAEVTVNLETGSASGGHAQGDTLTSIERVVGSGFNDGMVGSDSQADTLEGGAGNDHLAGLNADDILYGDLGDDFLDGGAGNDHLYGGAGSNRIIGGAGTDIAFFDGNLSQYEILSLGDALIVMGPNGKTQVSGVELLRFADGDVDPLLITCYPPGSGGNGALTGAPLVLPGLVEADKAARPPVLPPLDDMDPLVLPPVAEAAVVGDEPIVCRPDTFRFDPVDFDLDPPDLALMPGPRGPLGLMAVPFDNDWII